MALPTVTCNAHCASCVSLDSHAGLGCDPPGRPENGLVSVSVEEEPPQAVYGCREGYLLKGGGVRLCLGGGNWSGSEPECTCKRPRTIMSGYS